MGVKSKTCTQCNETKPAGKFKADVRNKRDGLQSWCRQCQYARQRQRRAEFPEEYRRVGRESNLKRNYGITIAQYEELLALQGGVCAICGCSPDEEHWGVFAVDHDQFCCHTYTKTCGQCVRALLCAKCNRGIGHFNDDVERMQKAIDYINNHKKR